MRMIDWMTDEEKSAIHKGDMSKDEFIKIYLRCKNRERRHNEIRMFKISIYTSALLIISYSIIYVIINYV